MNSSSAKLLPSLNKIGSVFLKVLWFDPVDPMILFDPNLYFALNFIISFYPDCAATDTDTESFRIRLISNHDKLNPKEFFYVKN
jgi:hypothetical protein